MEIDWREFRWDDSSTWPENECQVFVKLNTISKTTGRPSVDTAIFFSEHNPCFDLGLMEVSFITPKSELQVTHWTK